MKPRPGVPFTPSDGHLHHYQSGRCIWCNERPEGWESCVPIECPEPEEVVIYGRVMTEEEVEQWYRDHPGETML